VGTEAREDSRVAWDVAWSMMKLNRMWATTFSPEAVALVATSTRLDPPDASSIGSLKLETEEFSLLMQPHPAGWIVLKG
jgi:hypothetical protein